jgi:hypothetical protein
MNLESSFIIRFHRSRRMEHETDACSKMELGPLGSVLKSVFRMCQILLVLSYLTWTTHALRMALLPWRGARQLLAVGPWGPLLDSMKPSKNQVLFFQGDGTSQLISSSQLPPCLESHRRIVATSDTHGKHQFLHVPECDVLCHCGNILQRYGYLGYLSGGLPALLDFADWLQDVPAKHKVVTGGNHD